MDTNRLDLLKSLAHELTIKTGEAVQIQDTDYWLAFLIFPDGGKIGMSTSDPKKLKFYACAPDTCHVSMGDRPEIGIGTTRAPEAIAADIVRRLLYAAREYWQRARDAQTRREQEQIRIKETCAVLAPYMDSRLDSDETRASLYSKSAGGFRADVYPDGKVHNFTISELTPGQAIYIMEYLQRENTESGRMGA
jgi:hypothetical protein